MPLPQHTLPIVGLDYPNRRGPSRRAALAQCRPGDSLTLKPEPDNPADRHAIRVVSPDGITLGYISAERAPRLAALIARHRTVRVIFQGCAGHQAFVRIAYDEDIPCLPQPGQDAATP